ncbi:molybdopterin synthase subunit MoaD [Actinobacteria bacterium IMCC26256]|nr:molybdopterin synthase subunit MoaD [Actinobacteria bacterium IMCC26256]
MSVDVRLPTLLRQYTDGTASISVEGGTIGEVFTAIVGQYPGLGGQLVDDSGALHKFVNVYVNDEDIRYLDSLATPVVAGDVVSILPAVAGG